MSMPIQLSSPASPPQVAVIVLNWNGKQDTIKCLDSLRQNLYHPTTVYVVDNGSSDDSVDFFRRHYPEVRLLENQRNLGFAEGNNVALRTALAEGHDYFFLLNNDATVLPSTIETLVSSAERRPRCGMIGPITMIMERPDHFYVVGIHIDYWKGWTREIGMEQRDEGQYQEPRQFDAISGCSLMVKKAVLERVGLLDASFFAYFEEIDWCARTTRAGFEIWNEPAARVFHKGHGSNAGMVRMFLLHRNNLLFMRKNARLPASLFFWPYYLLVKFPRNLLGLLFRGEREKAWIFAQAVGWNFGLFRQNNPLARIAG